MRWRSAYSRHSARTEHSAHTCCATSTPVPSDGKNSAGSTPRQRAWNIHAYSSGVSSTVTSTSTNHTTDWFHRFDPTASSGTTHERRRTLLCTHLPSVQRTPRNLGKAGKSSDVARYAHNLRTTFATSARSGAERIHG